MLKKSKIAVLLITAGLATAPGLGYHYNLFDIKKKIQSYRIQRREKRGIEHIVNRDWGNAENIFDKINDLLKKYPELSLSKEFPQTYLKLAEINEEQGDYLKAIDFWKEYSDLTKEDVSEHIGTLHLKLANRNEEEGNYQGAIDFWKEYTDLTGENVFERTNTLESIIQHEQYLQKREHDTTVREELAKLYDSIGLESKSEEAQDIVDKAKKSGPETLVIFSRKDINSRNIEFRVPDWYSETMEEYDILEITEKMYERLKDLTGGIPFDNIQVLTYHLGDGTWSGNPILIGDSVKGDKKWGKFNKSKIVDGKLVLYDAENYPNWKAYAEEMAHNFTEINPILFLIFGNERSLCEGFASIGVYYTTDIPEGFKDLKKKGLETLKETHEWMEQMSLPRVNMYIDTGAKMENLSSWVVSGVLMKLQQEYGWDTYKEFFRIFRTINKEKDLLEKIGDGGDLNPATIKQRIAYITWGLSKAAEKTKGKGKEIKNILETTYGLRADKEFYEKINKEFSVYLENSY